MPTLLSPVGSPAPGRVILDALMAATAAHAFAVEPGRLVVRRVDAPIPGLPPALDGLRIGQISDLHLWWMVPRYLVHQAVASIAAESPDLVALTGDFVDQPDYAAVYVKILAPLRPELGSFACIGNHDYCAPDVVTAALQSAGVTVLRNQHQLVPVNGTQLCVVGVDDIGAVGSFFHQVEPSNDFPAALADSPLSGVTRLLLVHNPDFVMEPVFARETRERPIHLVLSGHTHGGQVRLPLVGPLFNYSRYGRLFGGWLARVAGTQVHVSRGVGASFPVRFNCPPEVNVITLRAA